MNAARRNRPLIKQRAEIAREKREENEPEKKFISAAAYITGAEYIEVKVPLDNPTKTITEMQKNGFWCSSKGYPVFVLPGQLKLLVLHGEDETYGEEYESSE